MNIAAFQQTIRDGAIRLQAETQTMFKGTVNVLAWKDDATAEETGHDIFDELFENPLPAFIPLTRDESYADRQEPCASLTPKAHGNPSHIFNSACLVL